MLRSNVNKTIHIDAEKESRRNGEREKQKLKRKK